MEVGWALLPDDRGICFAFDVCSCACDICLGVCMQGCLCMYLFSLEWLCAQACSASLKRTLHLSANKHYYKCRWIKTLVCPMQLSSLQASSYKFGSLWILWNRNVPWWRFWSGSVLGGVVARSFEHAQHLYTPTHSFFRAHIFLLESGEFKKTLNLDPLDNRTLSPAKFENSLTWTWVPTCDQISTYKVRMFWRVFAGCHWFG